jgi:hypothetical protein
MVKHLRSAAILVAACGAVLAQARPDFSGEWKMNPERSNYGSVPKPEKMVRKIVHEDPDLRILSTQSGPRGDLTSELKLVTDGKEQILRMGNVEVKCTARWDGATLRIDSRRPFQTGEVVTQEKWTLSDGGKTLTIATHIVAPRGETDITAVFEKQ